MHRVKELVAQLQMVSSDNARREDDVFAANKRIRQMEEAAAAHQVCIYICIYIYVFIYIYINIFIYIYKYIYVHLYIYI